MLMATSDIEVLIFILVSVYVVELGSVYIQNF